jgi:predicted ATPase
VLGHHAEEAGLSAKAIGFWQKAGELAVRRAANPEAIKHFRRALSLLGKQPDTVERSRNELAILSRLGPALMSSHGWASEYLINSRVVAAQSLGCGEVK